MSKKCEDCFWFTDEGEPESCEYGFCHRFPPSEKVESNGIWIYPKIYKDFWGGCGEFKPKS